MRVTASSPAPANGVHTDLWMATLHLSHGNAMMYVDYSDTLICWRNHQIRFPLLLEQGYSNVIDELCMRAQLPLCFSGD